MGHTDPESEQELTEETTSIPKVKETHNPSNLQSMWGLKTLLNFPSGWTKMNKMHGHPCMNVSKALNSGIGTAQCPQHTELPVPWTAVLSIP